MSYSRRSNVASTLLWAAGLGGVFFAAKAFASSGGTTRLEPFPPNLTPPVELGLKRAMAAIPNGGVGTLSEKTDSNGNRWAVASFPKVGPDLVAIAATVLVTARGQIPEIENQASISYVQNTKTGERQELAVFSGNDEEPNDIRKLWGLKLV